MDPLDASFRAALETMRHGGGDGSARSDGLNLRTLFEAQATSRHLDFAARELQRAGEGFYTIGSSGHEANALVALAARVTDPALLHYRSGAFYVARAGQRPGSTPIRDVLQGLMALADEPIAGGRHKVFGHPDLAVIPQTSTIASHLPRAVGMAIALPRAARLGVANEWPDDSIVVTSFGDASANHSTAAGAINTALHAAYQHLPVPLLLVCEDNGWGVSVPTPGGWIASAYGSRPGLRYVAVDDPDPRTAWRTIADATAWVREHRRPLFLHLRTVRFGGHAGSDAEISYRRPRDIETDYARDPLRATAAALVDAGAEPADVLSRCDAIAAEVSAEIDRLRPSRRLGSATEVMEPLAPRRAEAVEAAARALLPSVRTDAESSLADEATAAPRRTLAESINATLDGILAADRRVILFGEDVAVKGGVYGVTGGLARHHGPARVFDSLLDEQSILGLGLGAGLAGLLPIPEVQYLAYLHNAEDQLRGEAATLSFFSQGRWRNPMVVRIAGLGYQKGFGGHFHNDDSVAVLRDIPGLVVACPARGDDAAALLRTLVAAAAVDGTVSVFLEPIALYHRRDLHAAGDREWLTADHGEVAPIGRARHYPADDPQLTLVTFGNGVAMSLRVARRLADAGIAAEVLDLRWLAPLPTEDLLAAADRTGRVLVVDETRHDGGVGEGVITALVEAGFAGAIRRVASHNSFIPLGRAAEHVLLGEDQIEKAAYELVAGDATDADRASEATRRHR